jgi:hypothetical protein
MQQPCSNWMFQNYAVVAPALHLHFRRFQGVIDGCALLHASVRGTVATSGCVSRGQGKGRVPPPCSCPQSHARLTSCKGAACHESCGNTQHRAVSISLCVTTGRDVANVRAESLCVQIAITGDSIHVITANNFSGTPHEKNQGPALRMVQHCWTSKLAAWH